MIINITKKIYLNLWIFILYLIFVSITYFYQFNIKYKCCIRRYYSTCTLFTISIIRWTCQFCLLTYRKLKETFIPRSDYLTHTNLKLKWFITISWWIKFFSIQQCSCIMTSNCLSLLWLYTISWSIWFNFKTTIHQKYFILYYFILKLKLNISDKYLFYIYRYLLVIFSNFRNFLKCFCEFRMY